MSVNINHQLEQVNNLKITAVGTGATVGSAGIVTYYGDGSNITGISTLNIVNYSAGGGGGGGDAATLDGLDSLSFLRSDFADIKTTGDLRFNDNIGLTFGGSDNSRLFHDGTDLSLDLTAYVTDFKIRDGTTERYTFTKAGQLSLVDVNASGIVTANSFVKSGGTSSQYLMADGSVSTGGGGGGSVFTGEPVGTVLIWSGSAANIPTGYQLCDGSAALTTELQAITGANVPDLRDKFIVGATNSTGDTTYPGLSPGATGGSANAVLIAHSHTHNRATYRTLASGGAHGAELSNVTTDTTETVGVNAAGNSSTTQTGTNANLPPYYAFCYIIKHTGTAAGTATTRSVNNYTATAGQTLFPPSGTVPYAVGYIDVYLNGSKLDTSEFTASNGTTVTLTTGASLNDIVELVAYGSVSINDITVINDTTPQLGGDLDVNNHDITGTGNMNITGIATANGGQLQTESDVIALAVVLG